MLRLITTLEGFIEIKEDWNSLYASQLNFCPFQTYSFINASLKLESKEGRCLYILCYSKKEKSSIMAIFPFCLYRDGSLHFINEEHSDFCSAIINPLFQTDYMMYEEVFQFIYNDSQVKRIMLNHIKNDDFLLPYLGHFSRFSKIYRTENYSYFDIIQDANDKNYIASLRHLTAKERNRLKNISKKMSDISFSILSVQKGDSFPEEGIHYLSEQMIQTGIRTKEYFSPLLLSFFRDLYLQGLINIALVSEGAHLGSASLFYINKERNYTIQWIILYTDKKYNLWNKLLIMDTLYQNGGGRFNFGRGTYGYKIQHFRPILQNLFCVDVPKTQTVRFKILIKEFLELSKDVIRHII